MARPLPALCATLLLVVALVACGGDQPAPRAPTPPPATVTPSPAASPSPTPSPSSAAATATETPGEAPPLPDEIREIIDEAATLRQLEPPPTLRALTVSRRDLPDVYMNLVTDAERFELDRATKLYRLLGHLDEDEHLEDIQFAFMTAVLGFYSTEQKTLWVVTEEEGVALDNLSRNERATLVHEIIHALQDYHFDLGTTYRGILFDLDAELAFTSVVEGDATVHTDLYRRFLTVPAGGGRYFLVAANQFPDIPAPILRELYFPYTAGADWAREVLANHGVATLNAFLAEPPPATTLILHPQLIATGWEPEELSSLDFLGLRASLLPLGMRPTSYGPLGEFQLLNYLLGDEPYSRGWLEAARHRTAVDAVAGWAGDFHYFYEGVEQWVLVARVRFVGEEDAREFAEAHRALASGDADVEEEGALTLATRENGNVTVLLEPLGREIIFSIGTNAEVARAAVEPFVEG